MPGRVGGGPQRKKVSASGNARGKGRARRGSVKPLEKESPERKKSSPVGWEKKKRAGSPESTRNPRERGEKGRGKSRPQRKQQGQI